MTVAPAKTSAGSHEPEYRGAYRPVRRVVLAQTSARSRQLEFDRFARDATVATAPAIAGLIAAYRTLTGQARLINADVEHGRRTIQSLDLDRRTNLKAFDGREALLEELAVDRGLGWADIARLCGVSISAVRKWRSGGGIDPDRLLALSKLAAFIDLLSRIGPTGDPTGWMMMPLSEQHNVTAADLYRAGRVDDLLEFAQGHLSIGELLNRWNPEWQTETRSRWMVVKRSDGERVITRRALAATT